VCLCTIFLVPIDVYLLSSTTNPETGLKYDWATPEKVASIMKDLKVGYYGFYIGITIYCFVVMPWTYFYYEEGGNEEPVRQRALAALKYTSATLFIIIALFITGLLVRFRDVPDTDLDWYRRLITANGGERAMIFVIAVLILIGMLVYVTYTAYGLSAVPVGILRDRKHIESIVDLSANLKRVEDRIRFIHVRYRNSPRRMTDRDRHDMMNLQEQERKLQQKIRTQTRRSTTLLNRLACALRPFRIIIGLLSLALSITIVLSVFLASLDKFTNSICGNACGWMLERPFEGWPLDGVFLWGAK
ncbi:hypothetical protein HDV00_000364, partial [Rhizophlyctis rosea]